MYVSLNAVLLELLESFDGASRAHKLKVLSDELPERLVKLEEFKDRSEEKEESRDGTKKGRHWSWWFTSVVLFTSW